MKNLGKYILASVVVICGAALSAKTGNDSYFTNACETVLLVGVLYLIFR